MMEDVDYINKPTPMLRAIWQAWLDELRDPANKQAKGVLHVVIDPPDSDGATCKRCCMGVLADILVARGLLSSQQASDTALLQYSYSSAVVTKSHHCSLTAMVPWGARRGLMPDKAQQIYLENLNDAGVSFEGIANWIERYVPVVETEADLDSTVIQPEDKPDADA